MIYLDHAAMTPPIPAALEAYHAAPFGNPSSEHAVGHAAREALEQAREKIASLIGADIDCVYFFSTATEAIATALNSAWLRCYTFHCLLYCQEGIYKCRCSCMDL